MRKSIALVALGVMGGLVLLAWCSDWMTLQGQRTIYTAACIGGNWQGDVCLGRLTAAERHWFEADAASKTVRFQVDGARQTTGVFSDCVVENGWNWRCPASTEASKTIAIALFHGDPVDVGAGSTLPFHRLEKWRWFLSRAGVPVGSSAAPSQAATPTR